MLRAKLAIAGLLAALAVGGFLLPRPSSVDTVLRQYAAAQSNTVLIVTDDGGRGSGVVIKRGNRLFVFTAAHVVDGSKSITVKRLLRWDGGKSGELIFHAQIIFADYERDFALLWLAARPEYFSGATFAEAAPPPVGTPVIHCGNFLGADFDGSLSEGIVSQVHVFPSYANWPWRGSLDQLTATIVPGSSGGPVFNKRGEVLGLIVGGVGRGSLGFACYVPVRAIAANKTLHWALWNKTCPSDDFLRTAVELSELEAKLRK